MEIIRNIIALFTCILLILVGICRVYRYLRSITSGKKYLCFFHPYWYDETRLVMSSSLFPDSYAVMEAAAGNEFCGSLSRQY